MISLFRKIVLLATNFFLRLWLRKRSILKSFSGTKKVFFYEYFSERKICAYVFSADEWIERTRVSLGRKFLGGSILSVLWVRKLFLSLFLFFLLVLLSENGDRVSCYFFYLFRNSEGAIRGHQFVAFRDNTIVFRHTNELRNFALTTHNESFYLQLWICLFLLLQDSWCLGLLEVWDEMA